MIKYDNSKLLGKYVNAQVQLILFEENVTFKAEMICSWIVCSERRMRKAKRC